MSQDNIEELPEGSASSLWGQLRAARESRGLSIGDISAHLKLTPRQIDAIERGDLSALPGIAFARGFVRNYARLLDLDPTPYVAAVDAGAEPDPDQLASNLAPSGLGKMPTARGGRFASVPMLVVVVALFVLLSCGMYFHWFESREDDALALADSSQPLATQSVVVAQSAPVLAQSPVAEQSAVAAASAPVVAASAPLAAQSAAVAQSPVAVVAHQSAPVAAAVAVSAPAVAPVAQSAPPVRQSAPVVAATSAPAAGLSHLSLAFDGDSWVEVRDASGKVIFSRLNQAGAVQEVQGGTPPYSLVVGNASKVHLTWQGKPIDLAPYIKVDVARIKLQ